MPCPHTLSSLLARTAWARDGPSVQQARKEHELHEVQKTLAVTENVKRASGRISHAAMYGGVPLGPVPDVQMPTATITMCLTPTDSSKKLSLFKPLLREYGFYTHAHEDVYNAIVHYVGHVTFDDNATPADALAFAAAPCWLFYAVRTLHLDAAFAEHRDATAVAANLFGTVKETALSKAKESVRNTKTRRHLLLIYEIILSRADISNTLVSDHLFMYMTEALYGIFGFGSPSKLDKDIYRTTVDDLMEFTAAVKGISVAQAPSVQLNVRGDIIYMNNAYKIVGYCQEGVMLDLIGETVRLNEVLHLSGVFIKVVKHHNMKSKREICAGCNATWTSNDGRLYRALNPLISCDLSTAKDFSVHEDGSVSFLGQNLLRDVRTGRALRRDYMRQTCQVYDVHSLVGFDLTSCKNMSFLFDVGTPALITEVECEGLSVQATLERMDNYEVDENGNVLGITFGSASKRAKVENDRKVWSDEGNASFTLDEVIG